MISSSAAGGLLLLLGSAAAAAKMGYISNPFSSSGNTGGFDDMEGGDLGDDDLMRDQFEHVDADLFS